MKKNTNLPERPPKRVPARQRSSVKTLDPYREIKRGHYIRRLHQISDAIFKEETRSLEITPAQVAVLFAVQAQPNIDQNSLAKAVDFDAATVGGVIDRLEKRGLLLREASPTDRRAKLLTLTREGLQLTEAIVPAIMTVQKRLFAPLSTKDQAAFAVMLETLVTAL